MLLAPLVGLLFVLLARWRAQVFLSKSVAGDGEFKLELSLKMFFYKKVFWQLGEHLGRVKGELEEISILAEFCAQVTFTKYHLTLNFQ